MTIIGYLALIVAVAGLIVWFVSTNPKVAEAGKILFFTGMLAFLFAVSGKIVRVG